ncbi:MAG: hypothetical protein HYV60_12085 [Planctomycetia bacterium]|nr:hypothetical protein [Planctomycetia bacterium]
MFANAFAEVDANTGFKSDPFPAGTRVKIQGPGTSSQSFQLPASVVVLADGSIGQLGAAVSGNYLILDNRSPNGVELEFILPGGTNATPRPRPPVNPNNRSSQGTGSVEAKNVSGGQVIVRYTLPAGHTYSYNGQNHNSLYAPVGHGRTDKTPDVAENTRVTVDGYVEEFYVVRNALLLLSIHSNNITAQTIPINLPSPSPNPPLNPSPSPPSNPTSNPVPNPGPATGPLANVQRNAIPIARTSPLTSAVALPLAQRINKEVKQLLADFDRASTARAAALKLELIAAGFPEDGAAAITRATIDGDPIETTELFKQLRPSNANVPRSLESTHLAIATFRKSFTDLLAKIESGSSSSSMGTDFRAIKEQGTNLGAPGFRMP